MRSWPEHDVERLCTLVRMGMTAEEVAQEIGKTRHAVTNKAERLGLRFSLRWRPWSEEEMEIVARAPANLSAVAAARYLANTNALPQRSLTAIREAVLRTRGATLDSESDREDRRNRIANERLLERLWRFHPEHAPRARPCAST